MRFFDPKYLWFSLLALVLYFLWQFLEKRAANRLDQFVSPQLKELLLKGFSYNRKKIKIVLLLMAFVLGCVALARPQFGLYEETVPTRGLDLVFLLDVSNSMLAEDVVPSRLKKAKHIIKSFLEKLSGDRVGVVVFAGSAYPAIPLTTDYAYILETLEILNEKAVANQGTNLAKAMSVSFELLQRGGINTNDDQNVGSSSASQAMIVLSDGEDLEKGENEIAESLKEKNIRIYSIGLGSIKGGPIPNRNEAGVLQNYKHDRSNNMVHTKLESKNLELVANKTGGKFFIGSSDEGEISEILEGLNSLDRAEGNGRKIQVYGEAYQICLFLSLCFLFLGLLIREKQKLAVLIFIMLIPWQLKAATLEEYTNNKKGLQSYNEKDYPLAIDQFSKAQAADPESSLHHLNLGDAQLRSGAYDAAINEFKQVLNDKNSTVAAQGAYNLGRAYQEQKKYDEATQALQEGLNKLTNDPQPNQEVAERIKKALEIIQQQKQEQKQNQDQGKSSNEDKKQDQNDSKNKDNDSDKDKKQNKSPKQYQNPKPKFKAEKLTEEDAKKILKQLNEQEKQTQQRIMKSKTGKMKNEASDKDW